MKARKPIAATLAAAALAACGTTDRPQPVTHAQIVKAADREVRYATWAALGHPWLQQTLCADQAIRLSAKRHGIALSPMPSRLNEMALVSAYGHRHKPGTPTVAQVWKELTSRCRNT